MSNSYTRRAYGCTIIKSINSNFNADFSHQPRTLPDGVVYATDKALKYTVKNYLKNNYSGDKIFYFKTFNDNMNPRTLDETYESLLEKYPETKGKEKDNTLRLTVLGNLLKCLDIRLFGATFAGKTNISIHGPLQITHGINRFPKNDIYSEQIMSPFRNPGEEGKDEKGAATLGSQSKLREGHYVFHFSVNPQNIAEHVKRLNGSGTELSTDDIAKAKEALRRGATYYDSASKAGSENELLLWVELKEKSKAVLPSFIDLVTVGEDGTIDLSGVTTLLNSEHIQDEVETVELYFNPGTKLTGLPQNANTANL
ncbi:CRISPR-associated protein [Adhaeribacter arboris]|uniref:CRISPR-associated protein n=1 Tax=Adhaeribacter arboris TaxID=2072846 RepID=A0A2T2YHG3_9BACT|nr:type I CRISPR-associated protein Cas7 [Adhaeribacter arboris]PSR54932.1 CRISPR-associated protein [Adhaeribacter arboris]